MKIVLKNALAGLENELEQARDARRQIESEIENSSKSYGYEDAHAALPHILNRIYEMLLVVLEATNLGETKPSD